MPLETVGNQLRTIGGLTSLSPLPGHRYRRPSTRYLVSLSLIANSEAISISKQLPSLLELGYEFVHLPLQDYPMRTESSYRPVSFFGYERDVERLSYRAFTSCLTCNRAVSGFMDTDISCRVLSYLGRGGAGNEEDTQEDIKNTPRMNSMDSRSQSRDDDTKRRQRLS